MSRQSSNPLQQFVIEQDLHDTIAGGITSFAGDAFKCPRARTGDHRPLTARFTGINANVLDNKAANPSVHGTGDALKADKMGPAIGPGTHQILNDPLS